MDAVQPADGCVEIAFDVIVRSTRHGSGFSLRFPRIVRLRPDKTADEIDTVGSVTNLGIQLLSTYAVPFEVSSLILLVALLGSIMLARE